MYQKVIKIGLIVCLLCSSGMEGQSLSRYAVDRFEAELEQMSREYGFSGTVLVARGDEVLLNRGFGWASPVARKRTTVSTQYQIASLSKAFVAAAVLQLAKRGKIDLNAEIQRYLPDYPFVGADTVTVHHLLSHTSGIPDFINDYPLAFWWRKLINWRPSRGQLIGTFAKKELQFSPGDRFHYSNSGYVLLAQMVENVSGMRYEEYLLENIFLPLNMQHTNSATMSLPRELAVPHTSKTVNLPQKARRKVKKNLSASMLFGMGDLYSTSRDMFLWVRGIHGGKVLGEEMYAKMVSRYENSYGYGWRIDDSNGFKVYSHGGHLPGWNSSVSYLPELELSIVILSNYERTNPLYLSYEIYNILLANHPEWLGNEVGEE